MIVTQSTLPSTTGSCAWLRAGQINGRVGCTDRHAKDSNLVVSDALRLNRITTWRESTVCTDTEHATLESTEQRSRRADAAGGVTDPAWADAANQSDPQDDPPARWRRPAGGINRREPRSRRLRSPLRIP